MSKIIAVSFSDFEKFGCVHCGCNYCYSHGIRGGGSTPVICGECGEGFVVLADGVDKSRIGFGDPAIYPELQKHPREGILKHEYVKPDIRPDGEGEFFASRGVGYDLAGFVKSKQAGERIVDIFREVLGKEPATWLDYRKHEPDWIQVKVQPKDVDIEVLHKLVKEDGIITKDKIKKAMNDDKR